MSYQELSEHFRHIGHLEHVGAIIDWDEAVMMSARGGANRAEAQASLGVLVHGLYSDPRVADWLVAAESEALSGTERANLREMRREHVRATALDADLVEARTRAAAPCEQAWRTQRGENDWEGHRPLLE
ncbi:MAG: carboxypeptidase M32, partial [Myxococcales bacterium]